MCERQERQLLLFLMHVILWSIINTDSRASVTAGWSDTRPQPGLTSAAQPKRSDTVSRKIVSELNSGPLAGAC